MAEENVEVISVANKKFNIWSLKVVSLNNF